MVILWSRDPLGEVWFFSWYCLAKLDIDWVCDAVEGNYMYCSWQILQMHLRTSKKINKISIILHHRNYVSNFSPDRWHQTVLTYFLALLNNNVGILSTIISISSVVQMYRNRVNVHATLGGFLMCVAMSFEQFGDGSTWLKWGLIYTSLYGFGILSNSS